jgi:hypothetical protein
MFSGLELLESLYRRGVVGARIWAEPFEIVIGTSAVSAARIVKLEIETIPSLVDDSSQEHGRTCPARLRCLLACIFFVGSALLHTVGTDATEAGLLLCVLRTGQVPLEDSSLHSGTEKPTLQSCRLVVTVT